MTTDPKSLPLRIVRRNIGEMMRLLLLENSVGPLNAKQLKEFGLEHAKAAVLETTGNGANAVNSTRQGLATAIRRVCVLQEMETTRSPIGRSASLLNSEPPAAVYDESAPIEQTAMAFADKVPTTRHKAASTTGLSEELVRAIGNDVDIAAHATRALGKAIDGWAFDATRSGSLTYNAPASTSGGGAPGDFLHDLREIDQLVVAPDPERKVLVMHPALRNHLSLMPSGTDGPPAFPEIANGRIGMYRVFSSRGIAADEVVMLDESAVITNFELPELAVSRSASLQLVSLTNNPSAPTSAQLVSSFQAGYVAIKVLQYFACVLPRSNAIARLTNISIGTGFPT
jgi:hypothetical protein